MKGRELLREMLGIALLGVSAFLLLSVLSFDAADLPGMRFPAPREPGNLGGSLGLAVASGAIRWVGGLGALGVGLFMLHFGWSLLARALRDPAAPQTREVEPLRRLSAGVLLVLLLAVAEAWLAGAGWGSLARGLHPGGYWGLFLRAELAAHLGGAGAPILIGVLLVVALVLSLDRPVEDLFRRSVEQAQRGVSGAAEALAGEALAAPALATVGGALPVVAAAPERPARDPLDDVDEGDDDAPTSGSGAAFSVPAAAPSLDLLQASEPTPAPSPAAADARAERIEDVLTQFKLAAKVVSVERGPTVTLFALELGRGIKVQRLAGLLDNLALALRVPGIRLQAPIPGTGWVGLEVPNEQQEVVRLRGLLEHPGWREKDPALPLFLGKDSTGHPLIADLARMPHLLIAGATGAGKSVCINTILLSLLMTRAARDVRLILIDPKQVELAPFSQVPHLMHPVVTDMRQAGAVLAWAVKQMEQRYTWLAQAGVRHLRDYNELGKEALAERMGLEPEQLEAQRIPWRLPYVVLVVDELNDLMMIAQKEVEASITRLAQKSRAVGIHVVLATQRPSVDVITGVIKSNLPARIAFRVTSKVDSRTILDMGGAEKLLGQGDLLFLPPGRGQPIRAQGAFVTDQEIKAVVKAVGKGGSDHDPELLEVTQGTASVPGSGTQARAERDDQDRADPAYREAIRVVLTHGKGSVSLIQRKLQLGYARAARMLDLMGQDGIVGPAKGSKPRELTTTLEDWEGSREAA
ncbi:MAG: DNA translocase FtsK 4TM domain-containing protein [Planctomycetota bacterium]